MKYAHSDWRHGLFYLGLALLAGHELDAVARHEWRLLPVLNLLDDETGQMVFILAHLPLFAALFWLTGHQSLKIRNWSQLGVDGFLIFHGALHYALSGHPLYEFTAPVETITVYGGGIVGAVHLALTLRGR